MFARKLTSEDQPQISQKPKLLSVDDCDNLSIEQVHELYRKHVNSTRVDLLATFGFGNDIAESAQGVWITLKSGKRILDFTGGIGVLNHGHNHPRILAVRKKFQDKLKMEVHRNYFSQYIAVLSRNVAAVLPGDLDYAFFPNSGSEAVDGALKTAIKYHSGKRTALLSSDIAFHGKLLGPASVTNSPENNFPYPTIPNCHVFKYNDINSVKEQIEKTRTPTGVSSIAGIIVEPFNVSNMLPASEAFLLELREICTNEEIVLIFDEVYSGWAKTGHLFNFMRVPGLIPDVLCMAKSLGGGKASISGLVTRKPIFEKAFDNVSSCNLQTTTFYAFGEETVTAIEAINIIVEDDYVSRARQIEQRLGQGLRDLQQKYPNAITKIAGMGALHGVFFNQGPKLISTLIGLLPGELFKDPRFLGKLVTSAVCSELYSKHHILTFMSLGIDIHLIVSPPIVVSDQEIDRFLKGLDDTLAEGLINLVVRFAKRKFSGGR